MKSIFYPLLISLMVLCGSISSIGQKTEGGLVANAGVGVSFFGILGSLNFSVKDDFSIESNATPAFVGSIDYAFADHISIGLGGGYQAVDQTIKDYKYLNDNGDEVTAALAYSIERINVGARVLGHYGNGKVDVYSGLKVGVNMYNVTIVTGADYEMPSWMKTSGAGLGFQVIPIGFRGFFTDNIGFFMETGVGAPSFVSAGLTIGFQLPVAQTTPTN